MMALPLGSSTNEECRIDSLSQSWSVLSGGADHERAKMAMDAAYSNLVRQDLSLIQVLDPPFDKSGLNPGYIKGYVPGVRENGGQYTHAAIWLVMAFARLKNTERTWELFSMINPVNHGDNAEKISIYKAEPYVVAADVYSVPLHKGRAGWTWYTGSAGWMYRLIIESILGLKKEGDKIHLDPCIPKEWKGFTIRYRYMDTNYHISFIQSAETASERKLFVDEVEQKDSMLTLVNDHIDHRIEFQMGILS